MKRRTFLLSLVAPSVALGWERGTKVYHVDEKGSDANPGTERAPFRSIGYGTKKFGKQDQLYVHRGTYHEKPFILTCFQNRDGENK